MSRAANSKRRRRIISTATLAACILCCAGLVRASDAEQAVKALRKQVKAEPSNADLHYKLARALSDMGRFELQRSGKLKSDAIFDEAIAEYNRTITFEPSNCEARKSLASELSFKGKMADARVQLREIARLNPDDATAHLALARSDLHDEGGDLGEAIVELRAALEKDPGIRGVWEDLGEAQMRAGKFEDAAVAYREALNRDPNDDAAHYSLGEALKRAGHHDEAADQYREAVRLNAQWKDMLSAGFEADLAAKNLAFAQSDAQVLEKLGYPVDPQLLAQLKNLEASSK